MSIAASSKILGQPTSAEEWEHAERAQAALGSVLRKLFGKSLRGVNGFGARIDRQTSELGLQVTVDDMRSAVQAKKLPPTIEGLPVRVELGEAATAD
jgi:hypothetical protein